MAYRQMLGAWARVAAPAMARRSGPSLESGRLVPRSRPAAMAGMVGIVGLGGGGSARSGRSGRSAVPPPPRVRHGHPVRACGGFGPPSPLADQSIKRALNPPRPACASVVQDSRRRLLDGGSLGSRLSISASFPVVIRDHHGSSAIPGQSIISPKKQIHVPLSRVHAILQGNIDR